MPKKSHKSEHLHHHEHQEYHKTENHEKKSENNNAKDQEHNFAKVEIKIIENLVELQKVHTSLAEKFDSLTKQITALLALFEVAAKNFTVNPENKVREKDKEFFEKIDRILEQNKMLARGITLMEEKISGKNYTAYPNKPAIEEMTNTTQISSAIEKGEEGKYEPSLNKPLPKF